MRLQQLFLIPNVCKLLRIDHADPVVSLLICSSYANNSEGKKEKDTAKVASVIQIAITVGYIKQNSEY